jgi:hypothetical protein
MVNEMDSCHFFVAADFLDRTFCPTGDDLAAIDGATLVDKNLVTLSKNSNFLPSDAVLL